MAKIPEGKANPERGEMDIEVGGRIWRLRACSNQMIRLEEATGKRAVEVQEMFANGDQRLVDVRALFYSLLSEHQPDVTVEEVGDLMDDIGRMGREKAEDIITKAFMQSSPEPSESDPPKPKRPKIRRARKRRAGGTGAARSALPVVTE